MRRGEGERSKVHIIDMKDRRKGRSVQLVVTHNADSDCSVSIHTLVLLSCFWGDAGERGRQAGRETSKQKGWTVASV